jgi:hypothetical protein
MNIQARRVSGSAFSAEDKLEVTFNSDNQPMESVVHTIELVSGSNVTHGGGGNPDEYLHYKSVETDADDDGIIDYSNIEMALVQEEKGTSVIRVKCEGITKADAEEYIKPYRDWENEPESDTKSKSPPPEPSPIEPLVFTTGEITLEWVEDTFV